MNGLDSVYRLAQLVGGSTFKDPINLNGNINVEICDEPTKSFKLFGTNNSFDNNWMFIPTSFRLQTHHTNKPFPNSRIRRFNVMPTNSITFPTIRKDS
jgi:hypothetical protein